MGTAETSNSFWDGKIARLLSLLLAILIGVFMVAKWSDDFAMLFADEPNMMPANSTASTVAPQNPAMDACLDKRVGDVDRMLADGVINDTQYAQFSSRAKSMCAAQNQP